MFKNKDIKLPDECNTKKFAMEPHFLLVKLFREILFDSNRRKVKVLLDTPFYVAF